MKITFRADASLQIGTGHVMRCLTLADALAAEGANCQFICRAHDGNLVDLIRRKGYVTYTLSSARGDVSSTPAEPDGCGTELAHNHWLGATQAQDAEACASILAMERPDWLVVDHYALDARWERTLAPYSRKLMVIDDLADRRHDCDLLLDQNLGREEEDYGRLLQPGTQCMIGAQYALLRPEFAQWREYSLNRRASPQLKNLLITMGGVDQCNATGRLLEVLRTCHLPPDLRVTVVMGPHAPWLAQVEAQAAAMPRRTQVLTGVSNMAQVMAESDLAIGAAGSTNWERSCLGLPCLLVVLAANQQSSADALARARAVRVLDLASDLRSLQAHINTLSNSQTLAALSAAAREITAGKGAVLVQHMLTQMSGIDSAVEQQ